MTHRPTDRVRIEQAIAFGRSLDWILEHLKVTTRDLDDALRHMDKVNAEVDAEPLPCGTHAAYNRHRAHHEPVDDLCRVAEKQYQAARQQPPAPHPGLAPCGTHAAYNRHKKRGELIDRDCAAAEKLFQAERYRRRNGKTEAA